MFSYHDVALPPKSNAKPDSSCRSADFSWY